MKNFTRPVDEQPSYYSTTVEGGEVVRHDGDPAHAMYDSEIRETQRRAKLWHKWLHENVPDAYVELGIVNPEVMQKYDDVCQAFMNGDRDE